MNDFEFEYREDYSGVITRYLGGDKEVIIPAEIDGKRVRAIGADAFNGNKVITSVVISDGVMEIGHRAFQGCRELTSVKFPEGVTEIGRYAFQGCSALEDVEMEWGLKKISEGAFQECTALKEIEFLRSVTEIGECAFNRCNSLKKVDLPSELAAIADGTFSGCSSLDSIYIPDSVTEIGKEAFKDCASMRWARFPDDLKKIPPRCFQGCASLEKAELPDGLEWIGAEAYKDCTALRKVYLSESMTAICDGTFENCTALKQICFEDGLQVIGSNAFQKCSSLEELELPDTLLEIKDMAFAGCTSLEEVEIPDSVVKLAPDAFMGCNCTVKYKGEEFSSLRLYLELNEDEKTISVICEDGVFKAKGSFSLGILGTFGNNDFDDEQIQFDEDLLDAILDEDDFCEPFLPQIKSDDPDVIAKVLTEYYSQKERDIAANAKQINDCILYHLFADMEGCHYPFWEIPDAVLPGFLENHSRDDLESVVYCHADGGIQGLYEYFNNKPNNGTMEKPDVEELIRRLYPMFDLDGFIKSFKREELHFNGEYLSFQFSDGWGAKLACAAYDELDGNFTSTDWHND
ncbi:MAG: leucine-rich repeat domain-containing protein [Acetatifactor muris]|nr:leucine-rich repeat domain-containing protein [Acetatifactor muris]MCM1526612.1 leucine-rich repeat domain-containing protein [Bacteroides sp.]